MAIIVAENKNNWNLPKAIVEGPTVEKNVIFSKLYHFCLLDGDSESQKAFYYLKTVVGLEK